MEMISIHLKARIMSSKCTISINQYADFIKASEAKRKRIIRDQKKPNLFRVSYYQLAKARIRKTLTDNGSIQHIRDALDKLSERVPVTKKQISDKAVSIEALEKFLRMKIPIVLKSNETTFLNVKDFKSEIDVNGLSIIVAPEIIFKTVVDGKEVLGGVKLHVSKSNVFDVEQQQVIASGICKYLEFNVAVHNQVVLPEFCISLDIFGNGFITNSNAKKNIVGRYKQECLEILKIWDAA
ncbi:hypothetical protein FY557_19810 [Chryseobacterium sp. SN22]|uniref:hypothetical protein n=1 Tax=Chryseobacterium sp. SN22 TaxID=2606431 RepID=UPI0011EE216A|nr:hypothetical protein [Chryseobacterium sp. SN22]KAA0125975.1 hypothetical protein FY557_19810 [Chryseobacterium sp. SN22]